MKRKSALTLLEIMIVIVLIGLIGSVIGFNMKGSLDEGRAFKTEQAKGQIEDILMLEIARGTPIDDVIANPTRYLENSGIVKNPKKFVKDGWDVPFVIRAGGRNQDIIRVESIKLDAYKRKKAEKSGKQEQEDTSDIDE